MINKTFNFLNQKLLIIIFIFCIFIVFFSLIKVYSNRIIFSETDKYQYIEIESIMFTCEKYNMEICYPTTKNAKINMEIKAFIDVYITRLKSDTKYYVLKSNDEKFNLLIEYEIGRVNKDIVSFIFLIDYCNNKTINNTEIVTMSYNLESGKELTIDNFFEKGSNYYLTLCDISKEHLLRSNIINDRILQWLIDDVSNSLQNSFDGYAFSSTHLSIYFNTNKISSKYNDIYEVKIPWSDIKHLLNKNVYTDF